MEHILPKIFKFLLLGAIGSIVLYRIDRQLILKLNKLSFMNYRLDLEILFDQISHIKTIDQSRMLQVELDELHYRVNVHCKTYDMEDEFTQAYTLLVDKMIKLYKKEMDDISFCMPQLESDLLESNLVSLN